MEKERIFIIDPFRNEGNNLYWLEQHNVQPIKIAPKEEFDKAVKELFQKKWGAEVVKTPKGWLVQLNSHPVKFFRDYVPENKYNFFRYDNQNHGNEYYCEEGFIEHILKFYGLTFFLVGFLVYGEEVEEDED